MCTSTRRAMKDRNETDRYRVDRTGWWPGIFARPPATLLASVGRGQTRWKAKAAVDETAALRRFKNAPELPQGVCFSCRLSRSLILGLGRQFARSAECGNRYDRPLAPTSAPEVRGQVNPLQQRQACRLWQRARRVQEEKAGSSRKLNVSVVMRLQGGSVKCWGGGRRWVHAID